MLTRLHVRNYALASELELELRGGMTVLTGETGAGKSILVDALGLVLGDRADTGTIRAGAERAEVAASFDITSLPAVRAWLEAQDLGGSDECLLRRVLVRDGKSRAYVNGSPVPLQSLQQLSERLVDIHGQHAHQSLLHRAAQRDLLDAYAGARPLARAAAQAWRAWQQLEAEQAAAAAQAADRSARLELLEHQAAELDALGLVDGELEAIAQEHRRLANVDRLGAEAGRLLAGLHEDEDALDSRVSRARATLDSLLGVDGRLALVRDLLDAAGIQLREAAAALRAYCDGLEPDPARLQVLDARLAAIHAVARKHRVRPEDLPGRAHSLATELMALRTAGARSAGLDRETTAAREQFLATAGALSTARSAAAPRLAAAVTEQMQTLGMPAGVFSVALQPVAEDQAGAFGLDRVEFLVSANPGQTPAPLARVASGGELSRVSLALQVVTAGLGAIPTLVFDEVDVGIGGGVAEVVGRLLHELGCERQVLCVTHLAQVAAQGDDHYRVRKDAAAAGTEIGLGRLDGEARVAEIARMAGGLEITAKALAYAAELLARSGGKPTRSAGTGTAPARTRRRG
jgi:DNA repair protein RecN (Recombination protein N)